MSNFTTIAQDDGYVTPEFKIWSNLQFVALQQRLNAPINMKFGMKKHNRFTVACQVYSGSVEEMGLWGRPKRSEVSQI